MSFIALAFLPFFLISLVTYYIAPIKYRYLVILLSSYIFYGFNDYKMAIILALVTLLTYIGGLVLNKRRTKWLFAMFFIINIGILFVMKYTNFSLIYLDKILLKFGVSAFTGLSVNIIAPVGLSFYIFQSTTYLNDVYRKGMEAEKNLLRYAAFVAFFPSLLSGPIQKSRDLLPQLKEPASFSSEVFIRGYMLFVWGYFEKVVVSSKLKAIVDTCWGSWDTCYGIYALVAVITFSLYIYCDFSAYSDMACGVARMLGFRVKNNFKNPYLSTSLSQFWNNWHMTLNDWFIENVYIPLGGNRKGTMRKYLNVMVVFLFSGAWHGAGLHFVVWGGINAILQIIGQILKPFKHKVYNALKIDENCFSARFIKRTGVFILITFTWIFFRAPSLQMGIEMVRRIGSIVPVDLFNPDIINISGTPIQTLIVIIVTMIFLFVQYCRKEGTKYLDAFRSQPVIFQTLSVGIAIFAIIMSSVSGNADVNTDFIYFQF